MLKNPAAFVLTQRYKSSLFDREFGIRNYFFVVDLIYCAQAITVVARPFRRVERKVVWFRVRVGDARCRAHQIPAVIAHFTAFLFNQHHYVVAVIHGCFNAVGKAFIGIGRRFYQHTVYHCFNIVNLVTVQLHAAFDIFYLAVYPHFQEALLRHLFEEFAVVSFSGTDYRRKYRNALSGIFFEDKFFYLVIAVAYHLLTGHVTIGICRTGIEEAQEVINFCNSANSRSRTFACRFLLYGDDRGEAVYLIDIRPFEPA